MTTRQPEAYGRPPATDATNGQEPVHVPAPSAVEVVKAASRHLRGSLAEDLADGTDHFAADNTHLLKFHGIYQQDDRDQRRARSAKRLPLAYSCMVRTSVPGGVLRPEQWLALDGLTDELSNGTLRITTRQGIQFHFVAKDGLRPLISTLNEHLVSTLSACGDVVRNVCACPAPLHDRDVEPLQTAARALAARFRPHTDAYYELWIDGEKAVSAHPTPDPSPDGTSVEPIYGDTYLPRKFKIGFAWPGDNCVDVYTHDVGIVPHRHEAHDGWVVLAGGGLGLSHARPEDTYPRLASPIAWVETDRLGETVEAIVTIQRDHGNREDRQRARLKYTIDVGGLDWFRAELQRRVSFRLTDPPALPAWSDSDEHLGWWEQPDGRWFYGIHVDSGRVRDAEGVHLRSALRELVRRFSPEVRLTARQDVLLCGLDAADRSAVEEVLRRHGVPLAEDLRPLQRLAVACPALPTCGQALGEAERILPRLVDDVHRELAARGLDGLDVRMHVTGCPNGCARPYTAEIGVVGRTKSTYDLYVGGAAGGDRLAQAVAVDVPLDALGASLGPLFDRYRDERTEGEGFGDYCDRVSPAELAVLVPAPKRRRRAASAP